MHNSKTLEVTFVASQTKFCGNFLLLNTFRDTFIFSDKQGRNILHLKHEKQKEKVTRNVRREMRRFGVYSDYKINVYARQV